MGTTSTSGGVGGEGRRKVGIVGSGCGAYVGDDDEEKISDTDLFGGEGDDPDGDYPDEDKERE